ncbi:MAG: hypothetical protein WC758_01530 [Candidatus Woesearchaeota archaeon]|jgi:hypothetical protein
MDGWKRNGTGLKLDDFFELFSLNECKFYAPLDSEGLFESTVLSCARKNNLLIPSLGDLVDFVNINPSVNGEVIRKYISKEVLITSTTIEKENINRGYFFVDQANKNLRINNELKEEERRYISFNKFDQWINLFDKEKLSYEGKNVLEIFFNRSYVDVLNAMHCIDTLATKKLRVPNFALGDNSLSMLMYEKELIIYMHKICDGQICML